MLSRSPSSRPVEIVPSTLAADFSRLGDEVATLERAGADRIQWDVMDGEFVPNLTFGPDVIASVRSITSLPFEAHLMVNSPAALLRRFVDAGCEFLIVHVEACTHLHRTLGQIRETGASPGVALNPATGPEAIAHVMDLLDLVLVMTVNPGFGGQRYLTSMEPKIAEVSRLIEESGRDIDLEVDGGISPATIGGAAAAGANLFVSGSALFSHPGGLREATKELRRLAEERSGRREDPG